MNKPKVNRDKCRECKYYNIFWGSSGCNLINNMEKCRFKPKIEKTHNNGTKVGEQK